MYTVGFSGKSGTGKSYKALTVASDNKINLIVDDGLLICNGKVLAGKSAKKERSPYASTLRAIFNDEEHAKRVAFAIKNSGEDRILILGTSEKMVSLIAERIGVAPVDRHIHIEDVSSEEEIKTASNMRAKGKHVIPVPTIEIKRSFSGYFMDPLTSIKKFATDIFDKPQSERTIMRPKYGYFGDFDISEGVICQIVAYETRRIDGVAHIDGLWYYSLKNRIRLDLSMYYGTNIKETCNKIQNTITRCIDDSTSIYIAGVDVNVNKLVSKENMKR